MIERGVDFGNSKYFTGYYEMKIPGESRNLHPEGIQITTGVIYP